MPYFENLTPETFALLAALVALAGFIDSMAGGGGLITLPAYLSAGLPLNLLLGTNKLSSSMGTLVAAARFLRSAAFPPLYLFFVIALAAVSSAAGAALISAVPPETVRYLLIIFLPPAALFLVARKDFGLRDTSAHKSPERIWFGSGLISSVISFYDGLLGPGTGTFLALSFARVCGYDLLRATALSKLLNLTSNVFSLAAFLYLARVDIKLGLVMGLFGMAGNWLGAHVALKRGAWIIRPMLIIVSFGLLAKVAWDMLR
ncbi:MAG: putative permease [Elusimicrobia bacterium]|nr:MAG: putative permease [Elusimicrobiota bacterium]KAF0153930.1 MAG: putative permease [Elusimicrobiota bacterium]